MRWMVLGCGLVVGCGHTIPEPKDRSAMNDTGDTRLGHAPELVGFAIGFEEATGRSMLVATARLGDIDDNLVPDGTVNARLFDSAGVERTTLDGVLIGSAPTALPEPTMLRIAFELASDPSVQWEVHVQVEDRDGLASRMEKAIWLPDAGDTGG